VIGGVEGSAEGDGEGEVAGGGVGDEEGASFSDGNVASSGSCPLIGAFASSGYPSLSQKPRKL